MKLLTTEYTENILNIEGYKSVAPEKGGCERTVRYVVFWWKKGEN